MSPSISSAARTDWFVRDRFGMFIHWGPSSVLGADMWVRSDRRLSIADYEPAVAAFTGEEFDARALAALAKEAGMRYAVLTAKHHDGFCLFDTALTDYCAPRSAIGRDIVGEFVEAFREAGLKVGLYYSLLDWHHPDFPAHDDMFHPDRGKPEAAERTHDFDRYLDYMHDQVRELCTNYGRLDLLWFDFSYADMAGDTWRATELVTMIRQLQPNALMDNRLETSGAGFGSLVTDTPSVYSGDFVSPEQIVPPGGIVRADGTPVPWEACITTNNHWGFNPDDHEFKPAALLIRQLVECVSKGGNLLVNVGPDARGRIPAESAAALRGVGAWLAVNGESIYGAGPAPYARPDWGAYTERDGTLYAHLLLPPVGPIPLTGGVPEKVVTGATRLADGYAVPRCTDFLVQPFADIAFLQQGAEPTFTYRQPDDVDTVFAIRLDRPHTE